MKNLLLIGFILTTSMSAFSHGEDKLGPNKGYVKMPGGFHTEVVPNNDGTFKVYLLDIQFKNPTVKNSKVSATIDNGQKTEVTCSPKRNYFQCSSKKGDLTKGTLSVTAERNSVKANEAVYDLPLALAKTNTETKTDEHSGHH
ncbi:hypothetical protein [Pseudobdellovibrio sp. HCB154]|uniref:hypothetical protein n=1 Tax=Pseudobdellovibrio sp. HCB154 TaxID=3386277 RepID=UPI0039170C85